MNLFSRQGSFNEMERVKQVCRTLLAFDIAAIKNSERKDAVVASPTENTPIS